VEEKVIELKKNPVVQQLLCELRNPELQKNRFIFSANMKLLGILLAAKTSEFLEQKEVEVGSVLGTAKHRVTAHAPVLVNVLRAGTAMLSGNLEVFRESETTVIAASRNEETLECTVYYLALNDVVGREVIIVDPMLATGGTTSSVCSLLKKHGPTKIIVQCAFAAPEGIIKLESEHPDVLVIAAVVDKQLNEKGYIVPGLGDAGDLLCGKKVK